MTTDSLLRLGSRTAPRTAEGLRPRPDTRPGGSLWRSTGGRTPPAGGGSRGWRGWTARPVKRALLGEGGVGAAPLKCFTIRQMSGAWKGGTSRGKEIRLLGEMRDLTSYIFMVTREL